MEQLKKIPFFCRLLSLCLCVFIFGGTNAGICQEWSAPAIRLLPDSSFAVVELKEGQKIRYCPHHDTNGRLDVEQLIYVLGTIDRETWIDPASKEVGRKHLTRHYDQYITAAMKKGLHDPVNINRATLKQLVVLPRVGPILAVKIVAYRNRIVSFSKIRGSNLYR